jgi:hypothetical protein
MVDYAAVQDKILKIDKNAQNIFLNFNTIESAHTINFSDDSQIPEGHTVFLTNIGQNFTLELGGGNFDFGVFFNPIIQNRRTHVFIFTNTGWVYS